MILLKQEGVYGNQKQVRHFLECLTYLNNCTMKTKKIGYTILLVLIAVQVYSQNNIYSWSGTVNSTNEERLPYAHIQIKTQKQHYLFMSDEKGSIDIEYYPYTQNDTILVSSVGYKTFMISNDKLTKLKSIYLEKEIYEISEVTVLPKKYKFITLGNLKNSTIRSTQILYDAQKALYIPNNGVNGKIDKVKIYVNDFSEGKWKYRPFRLRLYDGEKIVGKELINQEIIACLAPKEKNWVEIDLSYFNIDMPKEGLIISVNALSYDYYKNHGYVNSKTINRNRINSISIGTTKNSKSNLKLESWDYFNQSTGWTQKFCKDEYYLMHVIIKHYE